MVKQLSSLTLLICLFSGISAHSLALQKTEKIYNFPEPPNCGVVRNPSTNRIFGGTEVKNHEFPWMVRADVECGGSLINSRWVLTAAHCYEKENGPYENAVIYLGAENCNRPACDSSAKEVKILKVISHEQYNKAPYENDIALLHLKEAVTFEDKIQPICLPWNNQAIDDNIVGKDAIVSGWGLTERGSYNGHLLKATLEIWNPNKCEKSTNFDSRLGLCAGGIEGIDSCVGDSGGPLFLPLASSEDAQNKSYYQVGIVSWGGRCGKMGQPGVYTNVSNYIPWIREQILSNELNKIIVQ